MALALGVHPKDRIYVNDTPVHVVELHGYSYAILKVKEKFVKVDDLKMTEIMPEVFVQCGKPNGRRINTHSDLVVKAHVEWDRRATALRTGKLTQEEFDLLPQVNMPTELLPRLLFEAPFPRIRILREELYLRAKRSVKVPV